MCRNKLDLNIHALRSVTSTPTFMQHCSSTVPSPIVEIRQLVEGYQIYAATARVERQFSVLVEYWVVEIAERFWVGRELGVSSVTYENGGA